MRHRYDRALSPLLLVLFLAAPLAACEGAGGAASPADTPSPRDAGDVITHEIFIPGLDVPRIPETGNPDSEGQDLGEDAGQCPAPYLQLPVVFGLQSGFSRAANRPSVRQWSDRARESGYKGLVFTEQHRLAAAASPLERLSDGAPEGESLQDVLHFDALFRDFLTEGEGAEARAIDSAEEPGLLEAPGLLLAGVADGSALAGWKSQTGFDFDRQDARLRARLRVPQKPIPSRVFLSLGFGQQRNQKELRWLLSWAGDDGDGRLEGDGKREENAGSGFRDYDIDLATDIREAVDDFTWQEGSLWRLDLVAEGAVRAIFDEVRLATDAFYAELRDECAAYSDSRVALLAGLALEWEDGERTHCVDAPAFPATLGADAAASLPDLAEAGCWRVASRPLAADALAQPESLAGVDAVEVWHPDHTEGVDEDWWDALLATRDPFVALAAARPANLRALNDTTPHNRVLAETVSREALIEALRAGRVYMSDHQDLSAEFYVEQAGCARVEIGESLGTEGTLHVRVTCPGGIDSVELVHVPEGGEPQRLPVTGAALGATRDTAALSDGYLRLVARCAAGERLYTNPIWLAR